jgi:hypothetical protein
MLARYATFVSGSFRCLHYFNVCLCFCEFSQMLSSSLRRVSTSDLRSRAQGDIFSSSSLLGVSRAAALIHMVLATEHSKFPPSPSASPGGLFLCSFPFRLVARRCE